MSRRMLIDGTHPEEVCVVVMDGKRLEEYDVETSTKRQLKGNIYLAKVTRVEPSLQAAFVDFGGNRHGFLAFNEIHPDYYQIPIEDREALLAEQEDMELDARAAQEHVDEIDGGIDDSEDVDERDAPDAIEAMDNGADAELEDSEEAEDAGPDDVAAMEADAESDAPSEDEELAEPSGDGADVEAAEGGTEHMAEAADTKDSASRRRRRRPTRRYKIQEVIRRRQILLVQVVKEERGNKGAALTTYVSLAGRYCVLMPNTSRGGGISRKITNQASRRKLKDIHKDLDIPEGMGVILRTAGMERNKSEIKRDFEYLLRAWDEVRELTLRSTAPTLVYEEASLIKRAIRDLYDRDMEEVLVEGTDAYQTAKKFMRLLMPSHAKKVQPYRDPGIPLFQRYQVESQLDAIHIPEVKLPSGGSIVIHSTEALVAVDVNSGKSTRERNIEETAVKTNLEAAEEVARQLRLRDLAGLIVIDFIDMEERRHIRNVEKRLKDAMKNDRARIQLGRISNFGLLELSRQRLRPSLIEASTEVCKHCKGTGFVRSTESTAVRVLRAIEEEGVRQRSTSITVGVPTPVALYMLNQKRPALASIERRYGFRVFIAGDDSIIPPDMWMERVKGKPSVTPADAAISIEDIAAEEAEYEEAEDKAEGKEEGGRRRSRRRRRKDSDQAVEAASEDDVETVEASEDQGEAEEKSEERRRPRRRRSRRKPVEEASAEAGSDTVEAAEAEEGAKPESEGEEEGEPRTRRRRRGRRGGRRRSRASEPAAETAMAAAEQPDLGAVPPEWKASEEAIPQPGETAGDAEPVATGNGSLAEAETETAGISETADMSDRPVASANPEAVVPESEIPDESETSDEEEAESLVEITAVASAAASEREDQPKRRGWWQRFSE